MTKLNPYQRYILATTEKPVEVAIQNTVAAPATNLPEVTVTEPEIITSGYVQTIDETISEPESVTTVYPDSYVEADVSLHDSIVEPAEEPVEETKSTKSTTKK